MPTKTTSAAFAEYDAALNLDPAERARAELFHRTLTAYLTSIGLIVDSFLQGSFARKTMLKPLRDIDKVVILHPNYLHVLHQPGGARQVATLIEDALRARYPNAKLERSRHSIQMDLGEGKFSFDVVPAFEVGDGTGDVWIMDLGKDFNGDGWKQSNTRALIRVVQHRNQATSGRFVHNARHVKHFVRKKLDELIPGLHVESIAFTCITTNLTDDEAAERILTCGAELLRPGMGYTDPTGVDRLSEKLDSETRAAAQQAFTAAAATAQEARRLSAQGDHDGANAQWFSIFGEPFPARDPASVVRSSFGGRITDAGNPTTRGQGTPARTTRSWRTA
jgi:hypothetical protein